MRIGFVAELFPPFSVGGAEISSKWLAQGLAKENTIVVITPNYGKKTTITKEDGVIVYRFGFPNILGGQLSIKKMMFPLVSLLFSFHIRRAVKRYNLELLHAQNTLSFLPTVLSGKSAKKVATLRDYMTWCDSWECGLTGKFRECGFFSYARCKHRWNPSILSIILYKYDWINIWLKKFALRRMDAVISVSSAVKNVFDRLGVECIVVHNIACAEIPGPRKSHGKAVMFVGKLSKGKGIRTFLSAACMLPGTEFIVVGDGPLKNEVVECAMKNRNLKYMGRLAHERVVELYGKAGIVCNLSVWPDPLSRVPIEALCYGVPCIATRVGGTADIIDDGIDGFLIEPDNPKQLAERIRVIFGDKKLSEGFSARGKEKIASKFSSENIVKNHLLVYKSLLEGKRKQL